MGLSTALRRHLGSSGLQGLAIAVVIAPGSAQQPTQLAAGPACPHCRIELEHVVSLGQADGAALIGHGPSVAMGSERFYVSALQPPYEIRVFSLTGRLLRVLGRKGRGPGEFLQIWAMNVDDGDSLHVFDVSNARWTVFSPELELVREVRLPFAPVSDATLLFPNGSVLLNAAPRTPDLAGSFYHIVASDGHLIRSIGNEPVIPRRNRDGDPHAGMNEYRVVADDLEGGFWSAGIGAYVLEHWNLDGQRRGAFTYEAPWFEFRGPVGGEGRLGAPVPLIVSMRVDSASRVWVSGKGADARWEEAAGTFRVEDRDGYWDSFIDVFEPARRRLLVSARLPQPEVIFLDNHYAYSVRDDALGVEYVDIYRVHLITSDREDPCATLLSRYLQWLLPGRRPCRPNSASAVYSGPRRSSTRSTSISPTGNR